MKCIGRWMAGENGSHTSMKAAGTLTSRVLARNFNECRDPILSSVRQAASKIETQQLGNSQDIDMNVTRSRFPLTFGFLFSSLKQEREKNSLIKRLKKHYGKCERKLEKKKKAKERDGERKHERKRH